MRLVIVGATGNVGTSLLRAVKDGAEVESVLGLALSRRRLRRPPCLVDPALARSDGALADERRRLEPRLSSGGRSRRHEPRLRVFDRRVLAGAEGPCGGRDVADRRSPDELLLAPQGRGGAAA